MAKLENLNVVIFESRLAQTLAELVRLQGGHPVPAPAMKEVPLENNAEAFAFAEKLLAGKIDVVIFLTGVGARTLLAAMEARYPREALLEALRKTAIVPRGPKPIRALKEWGVPYAVSVPEPNTWRELLKTLDDNAALVSVKDRVVALQEYGVSNDALVRGLKERGAKLLVVPVYRWALPDDVKPLEEAVRGLVEGRLQVALFTTAVQVEHLFQVAGRLGLEPELKAALKSLVVASVGPDCSQTLRAYGVPPDIEPSSPKMGPLVTVTAEKARGVLDEKRK